MNAAQVAFSLLELVARVLPGYLALLTGHATDAEALEAARAKIASIPTHPAQSAIDDEIAKAGR